MNRHSESRLVCITIGNLTGLWMGGQGQVIPFTTTRELLILLLLDVPVLQP